MPHVMKGVKTAKGPESLRGPASPLYLLRAREESMVDSKQRMHWSWSSSTETNLPRMKAPALCPHSQSFVMIITSFRSVSVTLQYDPYLSTLRR